MDFKKEIKSILIVIACLFMLSLFVDYLYPMLKAWLF